MTTEKRKEQIRKSVAKNRAKKKESGKERHEFWVYPKHVKLVNDYINKLEEGVI